MRIYTRKGDNGTTLLWPKGRVGKDSQRVRAYGTVDEAQAFIGLLRTEVDSESVDVGELLVRVARELWVLMTELATLPENRKAAGVTAEMVAALEHDIDDVQSRFDMPKDFAVPGDNRFSAIADVARATVRRAEREVVALAEEQSHVVEYLNRLSDLLWTLARAKESGRLLAKDIS